MRWGALVGRQSFRSYEAGTLTYLSRSSFSSFAGVFDSDMIMKKASLGFHSDLMAVVYTHLKKRKDLAGQHQSCINGCTSRRRASVPLAPVLVLSWHHLTR